MRSEVFCICHVRIAHSLRGTMPVKGRPILFNTEMVKAILEGRKTMTRRLIKFGDRDSSFIQSVTQPNGVDWVATNWKPRIPIVVNVKCPYGQVGDRLWVRETFVIESTLEYGIGDKDIPKDRPIQHISNDYDGDYELIPHYRATEPEPNIVPPDRDTDFDDTTKWTPSIHMPRWASRITLEIVKIRVERVQDISMADLEKESIFLSDYERTLCINLRLLYATQKFIKLWDSINAKRGYSWDSNSWVWSIEFKVVE